jgi:serine kinase of HPr protein (carbohydrate metabolism regulator)
MKVNELIDSLDLKLLAGEGGLSKEVEGVYCCDLLSWVMSHANKGDIWVTVQVHQNIIAVSSLLEFSCIIIPESIEVDLNTLDRANIENIPVLQSKDNSYKICCKLWELGI